MRFFDYLHNKGGYQAARRGFLKGTGAITLAGLVSGILASEKEVKGAEVLVFGAKGHRRAVTDIDILNFALNLEYLEAEYYVRGTSGAGLADTEVTGVTNTGAHPTATQAPGAVTGGSKVTFTIQENEDIAARLAVDEKAHVDFLRTALGRHAVARPAIDYTAGFNGAAAAAGIGSTFDPFSNEDLFLVGGFTFEDVGVTAYHGAAPYIRKTAFLNAAAGILAVEGYHAGALRTAIFQRGQSNPALIDAANKISLLRAQADGSPGGHETQPVENGHLQIAATDANGLAFARTFDEVLDIVYLDATHTQKPGGFFPEGVNGFIA